MTSKYRDQECIYNHSFFFLVGSRKGTSLYLYINRNTSTTTNNNTSLRRRAYVESDLPLRLLFIDNFPNNE